MNATPHTGGHGLPPASPPPDAGDDVPMLLDIGTAKPLARVRINGTAYAVKAPRVVQYAQFVALMKEVREAAPKDDGTPGDPAKQIKAVMGVLRLSLPEVPAEIIDELEIDVANKLIDVVETTINGWVEKREAALDRNPSLGGPSKSPGSGASRSKKSVKAIRGR